MLFNQHVKCYIRILLILFALSFLLVYYVANKSQSLTKVKIGSDLNNKKVVTKVFNDNIRTISNMPLQNLNKSLIYSKNVYMYGSGTGNVKIAVVLCGEHLNQTLITLKSAIMFSQSPLHFIVIADNENFKKVAYKLLEWPSFVLSHISFEIHPIHFPNGSEGQEWKNLFKLCACERLFLPTLLHHIDALIYVDTDVLFMQPIENLWSYFEKMNKSQIAALCPEHEDFATGWYNRFARHPYYEPLGVNSGVMLMNLTRMREFNWESYLPSIMKEYKMHIVWGDQDIINIIFHFHSEKLYIFPCEWNYRPDHCMYSSVCKSAEVNGIAAIHGNRGVFNNAKQPAFKAVYNALREYTFGDNLISKFYAPLKHYLDKALDNNCGKYLFSMYSLNSAFIQS